MTTTIDFDHFCTRAQEFRERVNSDPVDMIPVLALLTDAGMEIRGLMGEAETWPAIFEEIREQLHPGGAVLTVDMFLRNYNFGETPEAIKPRDDPRAINALLVAASDGRARVLPYAVGDDGTIDWGEPEDAEHPMTEALKAMCA